MKPPSSSGRTPGGSGFKSGGKGRDAGRSGGKGFATPGSASKYPRNAGPVRNAHPDHGRNAAKADPAGGRSYGDAGARNTSAAPGRSGNAAQGRDASHAPASRFAPSPAPRQATNAGSGASHAAGHPAVCNPRLTAPASAKLHIDSPQAQPQTGRAPPRTPQQGSRPQAPAGTIWLYGLHSVAAALANPARRLRRLLVTEDAEAALAGMVKGGFSVQPERTERARLDHLLGHDAVHQGVALLADPLPQPALAAVLERAGPILVLDQITDPRNVGAILRSAAAFGVAGVIAQDRHAPEETGALAKAASGALELMPLIRAVNLSRTLVALKAAGLWTVGLAADAVPLRGDALRERRVALVLGAEGPGMRRLTRETCDELAGLKMPGGMESLNVSAAAAVALYELVRA
jgi:23S rRNA (guanosine2251-2'-O)-methyltransferase